MSIAITVAVTLKGFVGFKGEGSFIFRESFFGVFGIRVLRNIYFFILIIIFNYDLPMVLFFIIAATVQ